MRRRGVGYNPLEPLEEFVFRKRFAIHPLPYYLGYVWFVAAITLLVPGIYGLVFETVGSEGFRVASDMFEFGVLFVVLGYVTTRLFMPTRRLKRDEALLLVVLTWIIVPMLVAWPVAQTLRIPFVDAWFESVSGFTTTGLTMFTGNVDPAFHVYVPAVEQLPKTVLLWRSFMQWIGGIGIVVVAVSIIARPGGAARLLYLAEGRSERIEPSVVATAKRMLLVYIIVTVVDVIAFHIAGMNWFDAVIHAMAGISTGGFSTRNNNIAEYNSVYIDVAACFSMITGAISFSDWYNLLIRGRIRRFLQSPEFRALVALLALGSAAAVAIFLRYGYSLYKAVRYGLFDIVTTMTTTGFQNSSLTNIPPVLKGLLVTFSLIGGSAFSTTGGIKLLRLIIAVKALQWEAESASAPRGYIPRRRLAWIILDDDMVRSALVLIFAFSATEIIGTLIAAMFLPPKWSFADIALETASALGNVGISVGITSAAMPLAVKILYIILMLLGRLEILPYIFAVHLLYSRLIEWTKARRGLELLETPIHMPAKKRSVKSAKRA